MKDNMNDNINNFWTIWPQVLTTIDNNMKKYSNNISNNTNYNIWINIDNQIAHNIADNIGFILLKYCNIVSIV